MHNSEPYSAWQNEVISFTGDGLSSSRDYSVADLEQMLELIEESSFNTDGETASYRGINLYYLLSSDKLDLKMATESIEIKSSESASVNFTLDELQSSELKVMLAYGKNGKPLVPSSQDQGYDADADNQGGPVYLIVNGDAERCLAQVTQVRVNAQTTEIWKHERGTPYDAYLDTNFLRICGDEIEAPQIYSLRELEAMEEGIVREYMAASEVMGYYEGLKLKYLLQTVGITVQPAKITVCSPEAEGNVFAKQLDVDDVWSGISSTTQGGAIKPVLLAYGKDGYPLVDSNLSAGYVAAADNSFGPLRLIVENNKPHCVKYVGGIIIGDGSPVAYTVQYLNEEGGEALSKAKLSVGCEGENITAAAEKINLPGYTFVGAEKTLIVLNNEGINNNIINLYYKENISDAKISLQLSQNTVSPGESVTASGNVAARSWVTIKIMDSSQKIILSAEVESDDEGNYIHAFELPAQISGTLSVVAEQADKVAVQQLVCSENGGGNEATTVTAIDHTVTMADGNQQVSPADDTWVLAVVGAALKEELSAADLEFTNIPAGITVSAAKQEASNNIVIRVAGKAESQLTNSLLISAKVLPSAFIDSNSADTNIVVLNMQISDCFIATAAFGSYLDSHVKVLRQFRDEVLLHSVPGRWLVKGYYQHSPAIAAVIRVHPGLKWITRILLTPIIFCLEYPLPSIAVMIGFFAIFMLLRCRRVYLRVL